MFVQSLSSHKNRTRSQTKMGKVYTKTAQKPYLMGRGGTYLYSLYKGVPPPGVIFKERS